MTHRLRPLIRPRRNKILMDREHGEGDSLLHRRPFQAIEILGRFVGHLPMKDLDASEPEPRRVFDDFVYRIAFPLEVPVGIAGNTELGRRAGSRVGCRLCNTTETNRSASSLK